MFLSCFVIRISSFGFDSGFEVSSFEFTRSVLIQVHRKSAIVCPVPKKLFLETFGCQMNVLDSELVLGQPARAGISINRMIASEADVIIYNTCSVRESMPSRKSGRAWGN